MSNFIKYRQDRINLDCVVSYHPFENDVIFIMQNGDREGWCFKDKKDAEDAIKWIDKHLGLDKKICIKKVYGHHVLS